MINDYLIGILLYIISAIFAVILAPIALFLAIGIILLISPFILFGLIGAFYIFILIKLEKMFCD